MGSFDAERYWRDSFCASLPVMNDPASAYIVAAMDELLVPLCGASDVILTRYAIHPLLVDYLADSGFSFKCNSEDFLARTGPERESRLGSIFESLLAVPSGKPTPLISSDMTADFYAVIPFADEFCKVNGVRCDIPSMDCIKRVNSKIYSCEINDRIGTFCYGKIARSCADMERIADEFGNSSFLIKDAFGVSGKGNILVSSPAIFSRVMRYLSRQERDGSQVSFVMEPFLDRESDFSCQMYLSRDGKCRITSFQKIFNNGFAYTGSMTANGEFSSFLESRGYTETMMKLGECLSRDGYFGDVCVDSMILKSGEIVPVVEINARKSMGLINHSIDSVLEKSGARGMFSFVNVAVKRNLSFEHVFDELERSGILYFPPAPSGILPLSANTFFINSGVFSGDDAVESFKGRFYYSVVADSPEKRMIINDRLIAALKKLEITVFNQETQHEKH